MILSYNWLKSLVVFDFTPQQLARELTRIGCCIEELTAIADDWQLTAEVTTNRPDWLCHWGIAHEIAALAKTRFTAPEIVLPLAGKTKITELTSVSNEAKDLCPRYTARVITGVTIAPSPQWLVKRLEAICLKPRNNIVDITNLVLFELNQPLHAFDLELLQEQRIIVRRALRGEKFVSVFGEERTLNENMCVIADAKNVVALAGIKGGLASSINDKTKNILLESAYFDPAATRKSSRATQLESDSSYRFERGIDPGGVERASARAAQLICELAGGSLTAGIIDTCPNLKTPWEVSMRFVRSDNILGMRGNPNTIQNIFLGLGLEITERNPAHITVKVPTYRGDLTREIDLIEEVARCHGYEHIPDKVNLPLRVASVSRNTQGLRKTREILPGLGYFECITDSFVPKIWNTCCRGLTETGVESVESVVVNNPVREDRPVLRNNLFSSLLEVLRVNRNSEEGRFFEINRTFTQLSSSVAEKQVFALADNSGIEYVRGAFEVLLKELGLIEQVQLKALEEEWLGLEDGSITEFRIDDQRLAICGLLNKDLTRQYDLFTRPALLEADFSLLVKLPQNQRKFTPLPRFPAIIRDIALLVPEKVRWAEILDFIKQENKLVTDIAFVSCYRGKQITPGLKSMAFALTYRHPERSLTDKEANTLCDNMVKHLTNNITGSSLR